MITLTLHTVTEQFPSLCEQGLGLAAGSEDQPDIVITRPRETRTADTECPGELEVETGVLRRGSAMRAGEGRGVAGRGSTDVIWTAVLPAPGGSAAAPPACEPCRPGHPAPVRTGPWGVGAH